MYKFSENILIFFQAL